MDHPKRYSRLPEYAFPRLRRLLDAHPGGGEILHMSIGEPKHAFPEFVPDVIARNAHEFGKYPPAEGTRELREAIAAWLEQRYALKRPDPDTDIINLNGTREGLFNACLALSPEEKNGKKPVVLLPNPFYQVYMVAALTAGAEPVFLPTSAESGFLPDFDAVPEDLLERTTIAYMCSPSNPQGAVASETYWQKLIGLAEKYDFKLFADECYSEIYRETPPAGALKAAQTIGADPNRVVVFHSLSKRSNLPGLRSGFAASGPENIAELKQLRAYAGAPLPMPLQRAAEAVWADEAHVDVNRDLYRRKFALADRILGNVPGYRSAEAGFFLWIEVEDGEATTLRLWQETGVRVLPGAYLSKENDARLGGGNPGERFIRVALVAPEAEVVRGLQAIAATLGG